VDPSPQPPGTQVLIKVKAAGVATATPHLGDRSGWPQAALPEGPRCLAAAHDGT
jgi:hypothetical protein